MHELYDVKVFQSQATDMHDVVVSVSISSDVLNLLTFMTDNTDVKYMCG